MPNQQKQKEDDNPLVCNKCGALEVESRVWINPNSKEIITYPDNNDVLSHYCLICNTPTTLILRNEKEVEDETK